MERLDWSARAYHRVPRLARTIADLDGTQQVRREHVGEAIQYRRALKSADGALRERLRQRPRTLRSHRHVDDIVSGTRRLPA